MCIRYAKHENSSYNTYYIGDMSTVVHSKVVAFSMKWYFIPAELVVKSFHLWCFRPFRPFTFFDEAGEKPASRLLDYQIRWLVMTQGKTNFERSQIQDEKENYDIRHTEHKRGPEYNI